MVDILKIKYLKNNTSKIISSSNKKLILPGDIIGLTKDDFNVYKIDNRIVNAIRKGELLVSTDGRSFYTNPVEGTLVFENEFDDGGQIMYGDNLIPLTPGVRRDPETGIKGTSLSLAIFQILKDFYNDPLNPLYTGPHETVFWDNVPRLKETVLYFEDKIKMLTYNSPLDVTVYTGQPIEKLLKFDAVMFMEPNDTIIDELKSMKKEIYTIGTVSTILTQSNFESRILSYNSKVNGIYLFDFGYGKGTVDTNCRLGANKKLDYLHSNGMFCIIDCENIHHALGTTNDALLPNSIWNSTLTESTLREDDKYVINNFVTSNTGWNDPEEFLDKMNTLFEAREQYKICLMAVPYLDPSDPDKQKKYDIAYMTSLLCGIDGFGTMDTSYDYICPWMRSRIKFWERYPKIYIKDGRLNRYTTNCSISVEFSDSYYSLVEEF
jgi:hypothetical protein